MAYKEEPSARAGCVSATIDSKVFVWGGQLVSKSDTSHLNYLYCFESLKEKWKSTHISGQHPSGYKFCGSTQSGSVIYIYGGVDADGHLTGSLFSLHLELLSWRELSPPVQKGPNKKAGCGMAVNEENIIVFGGDAGGDKRNCTNELHVYRLSTGSWISPISSGEVPQPCSFFSFDKVNKSFIVLFGGANSDGGTLESLYTLDVNNMHWTNVAQKLEELWPEKRGAHGSMCLADNTGNAQLLISGGARQEDKKCSTDMWLLDIATMTWKEVQMPADERTKRCYHTIASVSTFDEFTEVVLFGGINSYDEDNNNWEDPINETTLLRFANKLSSSSQASSVEEWSCTEIAGLDILGSIERVQLKKKLLGAQPHMKKEKEETEMEVKT